MTERRTIEDAPPSQPFDPEWKAFIRAGGIITFLLGIIFVIAGAISAPTINIILAPSIQATLQALNSNVASWDAIWVIAGVVDVLLLVVFTALYVVLRRGNPGIATIALILAVVSLAIDLATEVPLRFVVVGLSSSYATATTQAQQAAYLATAEMAQNASLAAGAVSTLLLSTATILMGYAMLRGQTFGRRTAYIGIIGGILTLPLITFVPAPSSGILLLGYFFYGLGELSYLTWVFLAGYRLYRLGS